MIEKEYVDGLIKKIERLQQERDALAAQVLKLVPLARRCAWGALVWNDHNYKDLRSYCKEDIRNAGIFDIDSANEFLTAPPQQCLRDVQAEAVRTFVDFNKGRFTNAFDMYISEAFESYVNSMW